MITVNWSLLFIVPFLQLILWDRETCAPHWSTPTLGGFIYQLAVAPQDTATIAMGVGDNMIRVWNTQGRGASCKSTSLWQGLKSKVTAVSIMQSLLFKDTLLPLMLNWGGGGGLGSVNKCLQGMA